MGNLGAECNSSITDSSIYLALAYIASIIQPPLHAWLTRGDASLKVQMANLNQIAIGVF